MRSRSNIRDDIKISGPVVGSGTKNPSTPPLSTRIAGGVLRLRPETVTPQGQRPPIQLVCISDTHNSKPDLPPGDILLHAGDLSQYGTFDEVQAQLDWLNTQPHAHKIVIAGNHDLILDDDFAKRFVDHELNKPGKSKQDLNWGDIVYLQDSSIDVQCGSRTLKVYGSPHTPKCGNFAFQYELKDDIWKGRIPEGTDIVLTHGPPALHLDGGKGCASLLKELRRVSPSAVVFGHIHSAHGQDTVSLAPSQRLYQDIALEEASWGGLPSLMLQVLKERIWSPESGNAISVVNAACYDGKYGIAMSV